MNDEVKGRTSMVDGMLVHSRGGGPGIILLHANGGDHRDFDAIVDVLAERFAVHAVDWPGHGGSAVVTDPGALTFAGALPSVVEQIGQGPFILIGNSVGGFAALQLAAARPDLVAGLVLVAPGGFTPRWPLTQLACRIIASQPVAPYAMRLLPRLYLRRRTPLVTALRARAGAASRQPSAVATFSSLWRSFTDVRHDSRPAAAVVEIPTMLVWGTRDPILPWRVDGRRARNAIPHGTVATFPCGHQPFAEMPAEFIQAVDPFLDAVAVRGEVRS